MGMAVAANDAAKMMSKAQMTGYTQQLRADQKIREVDKQREMEAARDADPDSGVGDDAGYVGSSAGATRTLQARRTGSEPVGRGAVDWGKSEEGIDLPPSLRPQARGAGSTPLNVPYWLLPQEKGEDSAATRHRRLLDGMRKMVRYEIEQYVQTDDALYSKKTLRAVYDMLRDERSPAPPVQPSHNWAGEVPGLSFANLDRARVTRQVIEHPTPRPGQLFDLVA